MTQLHLEYASTKASNLSHTYGRFGAFQVFEATFTVLSVKVKSPARRDIRQSPLRH